MPGSLLGVMWREEGAELVRFEPRSLEPLPGGRLPLKGAWPWAYSPSGSQVALASCDEAGVKRKTADLQRVWNARSLDCTGCVVPLETANDRSELAPTGAKLARNLLPSSARGLM